MIRRWRRTGYNHAIAGTGNDTDALQTDVMRFMSILGLCLMAVFALVQSLPLQKAAPVQPDPERIKLQEDIATQQQRVQLLKAELERLHILVEQAKSQKMAAERTIDEAAQQLTQIVDQTEQTRNEHQRLKSELKHLQQRLEHGRQTLASLQQAANDKAQSLRSLQQRLELETRNLDYIRDTARDLQRQQAAEERMRSMRVQQQRLAAEKRKQEAIRQQARIAGLQQTSVTPAPVVEKPAHAPVKKGFTLRFASAEALRQQIETDNVSLYAMADKQAWRLRLQHGRPVFSDAAFPGWFHEMATATVPVEFVSQLKIAVAPKTQSSVVWGVQLPPATKRDIDSLIHGRQGGELVIAANGRVSLAAE